MKIDYLKYEDARVGMAFCPEDEQDERFLRMLATAKARLYFHGNGSVKSMSMLPSAGWSCLQAEAVVLPTDGQRKHGVRIPDGA